jgi:hypothetical protein
VLKTGKGSVNVANVPTSSEFFALQLAILSSQNYLRCVFEKHRRGRKPGSKYIFLRFHVMFPALMDFNRLSEASKMLRRLEKGLNSAKMKSQTTDNSSPYQASDSRLGPQDSLYPAVRPSDHGPNTHFPSNELPPLNLLTYQNGDGYLPPVHTSRSIDMTDDDDDDDDDGDHNDESFFPAKLIRRENQRNSFFRTILNPEESPADSGPSNRGTSYTPPQIRLAPLPSGLNDPITAGIINEEGAKMLFDLIYLRLNPFINLFDPALHSVTYVRSKCPFLFTTLIMAGCKFFKPEIFKPCQKLANDFAVRAFAEAWKRVEVVQAFACLTYWKDPDDNVRRLPLTTFGTFDLFFHPLAHLDLYRICESIEVPFSHYSNTPNRLVAWL